MSREFLFFGLGCAAVVASVSMGLAAGFQSQNPAIGVLVFIAVGATLCYLAGVAELSVRAIRRSLAKDEVR